MKKEKTDSLKKNRKIALFGVLCAEAVALSYLEGLLPSFIPLPTAKAGLSNIITMYGVSSFGFSCGLLITLFKALTALLTRGVTAAFLSLSGGVLSLVVMTLLFKLPEEKISFIALGVLSAFFHNLGQLIAAYFILGKYVFSLAPYLALLGAVTGAVTGAVYKYTAAVFRKQQSLIIKTK